MLTVQGIFKILIGTIATIVIVSIIIEYINVVTASMEIQSMVRMSVRQAAVYFQEETYMRDDASNINNYELRDSTGNVVAVAGVDGRFYTGSNKSQVWNSLYGTALFSDWYNTTAGVRGTWNNLDIMMDNWTSVENASVADDNTRARITEFYIASNMTPLNMGITYLDRDTLERISRWNATAILSNSIINDDGGYTNIIRDAKYAGAGRDYYVKYKGFDVFATSLRITGIDYRVFNVNDAAQRLEFQRYTNINAANIVGYMDGAGDDRRNICVAGINYFIEASYNGVTPLKNIIGYINGKRVVGMNSNEADRDTGVAIETTNISGVGGGGFEGNILGGAAPINGRLVYYVVR
jgi:hypothetical protein